MKIFSYYLILLFMAGRVFGQVLEIDQFKIAAYSQTNQSPPTMPDYPNAYYLGITLHSDPAYDISLPMVFTTSMTTGGEFIMNQNGPFTFGYGSPVYSDKSDFDDDYPNGLYNYFTDYTDTNDDAFDDNLYVQVPADDLYSTNLPAFAPECWKAMQQVDPAMNFNLSWNSYNKMPAADYAYTFIGTYDSQTFNSQFGGFNFSCPPAVGSTVIPAGSFQYGRTYIIQIFFSNRVTPALTNENGSAASLLIGFDTQTHARLATIPPPLRIASLAGDVLLVWPALAVNYKLQTADTLPNTWTDVTNSPAMSGTNTSLMLPASHASAFFRLAPR